MSLRSECLQPDFENRAVVFLAVLRWLGISATLTSVCRTRVEQERLFRRAQAGRSKLPAARPGRSLHETGRAIDVVIPPADLPLSVEIASLVGLRWGGQRDPVHFSR